MLVDKDAHQRETITKWPIWQALRDSANKAYIDLIFETS